MVSLAGAGSFLSGAGSVASAVGSLFGGGSNKGAPNRFRDLKALRHWANKGGVHPLAALGMSSTSGVASGGMIPWGDALAEGAMGVGRTLQEAAERRKERAELRSRQGDRELNRELIRAQIGTEKAKSAALLAEAQSRTEAFRIRNTPGALGRAGFPSGDDIVVFGRGLTPGIGGVKTPTQQFEDEYGDVAGAVYGLGRLGTDLVREGYDQTDFSKPNRAQGRPGDYGETFVP